MGAARQVTLASLLVMASAAGCTLFTDLSGFSETAPADASADASTSDAPDGDGDASGDAGADAAQACTPPSFCDDFERTDPRGLWDNNTSNGSSITIDSTKFHSGTRSLRADLTSSSAERTAYLERLLPAGTLGVKITLFFRFDAAPANTDVIIASFQLNNPVSSANFGFYSDGLRFTAATTSQQQVSLLGAPKLGEWDKLTLEVRRSVATATPTLRVTRGLDDRVLVDEPAPFTLGTFANVHLGVCYSAAGTTTATVWLDDVRIDLE